MTDGRDKVGNISNVRKFVLKQRPRLAPNSFIIEALEELLDLAMVGDIQQLGYAYITQDGDWEFENVGYMEGYEETFTGVLFRLQQNYERKLQEIEEMNDDED